MEVSINDIARVVASLPIGYYALRKVPLIVEEKAVTSFFDPRSQRIVISASCIQKVLANIPENSTEDEIEAMIRSQVYHEVGHTLLTPEFKDGQWSDILNIFEDERIETVLKNYFKNVDFKKHIKALNEWNGVSRADNARTYFYEVVRFRAVHNKRDMVFLDRVRTIIGRYQNLTSSDSAKCGRTWEVDGYVQAVNELWEDIRKRFAQDNNGDDGMDDPAENYVGEAGSPMPSASTQDKADAGEGEEKNKNKTPSSVPSKSSACYRGDPSVEEESSDAAVEFSEEDKKAMEDWMANNIYNMQSHFADIVPIPDQKFTEALARIVDTFNKRSNGGGTKVGYDGVLNPLNCVNKDYRWFDRKASINGLNKWGSLNLNLFVDVSGSMYHNQRVVNQILYAVRDVARTHKNFTFSITACGCGQTTVPNATPSVIMDDGNSLTEEIYKQYDAVQKPSTINYNIALFDGDCGPHYDNSKGGKTTFSVFNHRNCLIITERSNEKYTADTPQAKVIITTDYANKLKENILKALEIAFR